MERIMDMTRHICDNIANPNHIIQKGDSMPEKKLSIIDKIVQNRKVIIRRTLKIGGAIIGAVVVAGFLAKNRFEEDEDIIISDIEDGSFTITEVPDTPEEN